MSVTVCLYTSPVVGFSLMKLDSKKCFKPILLQNKGWNLDGMVFWKIPHVHCNAVEGYSTLVVPCMEMGPRTTIIHSQRNRMCVLWRRELLTGRSSLVRNDVVQTRMCQFLRRHWGKLAHPPPPPHIRNILYRPAWSGFLLLYRPASLPPRIQKLNYNRGAVGRSRTRAPFGQKPLL